MVLVPFERVDLQLVQPSRRPVQKPALLGDPLQKERIGAVDQRNVDVPTGQQRLEIPDELSARLQRRRPPLQRGQIDVARRVRVVGNRRSELQQQTNAMRAALRRKPIGITRIIGPKR